MEVYGNSGGKLTVKSFYNTKKGINRRVMELENSESLLPTSETYSGAFLSDAKIPQLFEIPRLSKENNTSEKENGNVINTYKENVRGKQEEIGLSEKRPSYGMDSTQSESPANSESSISDSKDTIIPKTNKTKAVNIITEIEKNGKKFLVGLSLNPEVGGKKLDIHSIRLVFPKDTHERVNRINQGKGLYFDKEKVLNFLTNSRHPADVAFGLPENQAQQEISKLYKSY